MTDSIQKDITKTAAKTDSPHYEQAKKIVDRLNLHDAMNVNDYPHAINTVIHVLEGGQ